jgi:DNA-binding transcriptional MerR regulator
MDTTHFRTCPPRIFQGDRRLGFMTITEVGKMFGLSVDTLRYYERIGLIPKVNRTSGGVRNYTEEDRNWVEFIKRMRGAGVQIEALVEYVALCQQGDSTAEARKQILIEQRDLIVARMVDMQKTLERMNYKIENYGESILPNEKELKENRKLLIQTAQIKQ